MTFLGSCGGQSRGEMAVVALCVGSSDCSSGFGWVGSGLHSELSSIKAARHYKDVANSCSTRRPSDILW